MKEKRILDALNFVDDKYVLEARPRHRKKKSNGIISLAALAACFVLIWASAKIFSTTAPEQIIQPPIITDAPIDSNVSPEPIEDKLIQPLKLNGGDVGTLHFLQASVPAEATPHKFPDFLIYVNHEAYYIRESDNGYVIAPTAPLGDLPACKLEINWQPDISVEAAAQALEKQLSETMTSVSPASESPAVDGLYIRGSNGSDWDSEITEIHVTDDLQGGVFIFTSRYFMEAAEGHGVRFADMLNTFEVVTPGRPAPAWFSALRDTTMRFIPAFLKDDMSSVNDILAPDAMISTYGEDVYSAMTVSDINYTIDDDQAPSHAVVSLRHRPLEDSYDYITIELSYSDGSWKATWAGIEK